MNGLPLHPAVVHFPVAIAMLLPIFAVLAFFAIRRGTGTRRGWGVPVLLAALLVASAFVALKTGENEEERVENIVSESVIHEHEEAAEIFLYGSIAVLALLGLGLMHGRPGTIARMVGTVGTFVVALLAFRVGSAGGELVYQHGAASAYTDGAAANNSVEDDDD